MLTFFKKLLTKKKKIITLKYYAQDDNILEQVKHSYLINSIHKRFFYSIRRINFKIFRKDKNIEDILLTDKDQEISLAIADFLVYSRAILDYNLNRISPLDLDLDTDFENDKYFVIENKSFVHNLNFVSTILEFERLLREVLQNSTSMHFFVINNTSVVTDEALVELREMIRRKRKEAGAGGIEIASSDFDIKTINNAIENFKLDTLMQIIEEILSKYYSIPAELIDTESSTYNNKILAERMFFTNIIIPTAKVVTKEIEKNFLIAPQHYRKNIQIDLDFETYNDEEIVDIRLKKLQVVDKLLQIKEEIKDKKIIEEKINNILQNL